MPLPYADEYLPYWYLAHDEEIGILILTTAKDRAKLVNTLYEARQRADDPELEELILMQPKVDMIYIAKKATELDE